MLKVFSLISVIILFYGCENPFSPADLTISHIEFTETYSNKALDLPNGVFMPDNPDFDINKPETWTGNMAKYVNYNYIYSVKYEISNLGGSTAYDSEVDIQYSFDNGDEVVETIYIGEVDPSENISKSTGTVCTNKKLIECSGEVFWYD